VPRRVSVSVSIGAAEASRRAGPAHEVLAAADAALYRAKRGGRNRVCTS
jgi:PleD family two-component response regulator